MEKHTNPLEVIIKSSEEFINYSGKFADYKKITETALVLSNAKYVVLNIFSNDSLDFNTVGISGVNPNIEKAAKILGFDILNKQWKHDPNRFTKIKDQQTTVFEDLQQLTGTTISLGITNLVAKVFNLGIIVIVKIQKEKKIFGDFTFLFDRHEKFDNQKYVELYSNQVGLFLDKLQSDLNLKLRESYLSAIVENQQGLFWLKDKEGKFLEANKRFLETSGINSIEKLIGLSDKDIWPPDLAKKYNDDDNRIIESGKDQIFEELITNKNETKWFETHKAPIFDSNNEIIGTTGYSVEITKRKLNEINLIENAHFFRSLIENISVGIIIIDPISKIIEEVNTQAAAMIKLEPEEIIGKKCHQFLCYTEEDKCPVCDLGLSLDNSERQLISSDKSETTVLKTAKLIEINGKQKLLESFVDISNLKKAEATLAKYSIELKTKNSELDEALSREKTATNSARDMAEIANFANHSKSLFLANMSHEIRTPLNAIIGFAQLNDRDKNMTPKQREYNSYILKASNHLLGLINDILDLSKIEAGKIQLSLSNVNINEILSDIKVLFKERAESKRIRLSFLTSENIPDYIIIDEKRFRQIIINLIGNAIKFTEKGSVTIYSHIEYKNIEDKYLVVEVKDTGVGIDENEIDNLFGQFVQTSAGIKQGSGTGLGLSLSKKFAKLMGGDISVSSKPEEGTVFSLTVKYEEGLETITNTKESKLPIGIADISKSYKVLIVDDNENNILLSKNILEYVGFETEKASNGYEAIEKFEQWKPDLILMDLIMPGLDGYKTTLKIRELEKDTLTPIIIVSGKIYDEEQKDIKQFKIQAYIKKPFTDIELLTSISKILQIEYNYDEPNKTNSIIPKSGILTDEIEDIHEMDIFIRKKIIDAAESADIDMLNEQIDIIKIQYPKISELIIVYVNKFDYLAIANLLKI